MYLSILHRYGQYIDSASERNSPTEMPAKLAAPDLPEPPSPRLYSPIHWNSLLQLYILSFVKQTSIVLSQLYLDHALGKPTLLAITDG